MNLYLSPRLAERFLKRCVSLDTENPDRVEAFRKTFARLLPQFSPASAITTELRAVWEQPNPLSKKRMLLRVAACYLEEWKEQEEENQFPMLLLYAIEHANLLRCCQNLECKKPYFVARRGSQVYCSEPCAEPAKREAKRRWWHRNR
jgi:hypothetical protein